VKAIQEKFKGLKAKEEKNKEIRLRLKQRAKSYFARCFYKNTCWIPPSSAGRMKTGSLKAIKHHGPD